MSQIATHDLGGSDGPPALFIHCALGRSRDWTRLRAALSTPLRAHAFDLPGHGASAAWDGQGDYHRICTDHAREALTGDRPAILIGHSFGATVALRLALEQPDFVRALVLIEPVLYSAARGTPEFDDNGCHDAALAQAMAAGDCHAAARGFLARWGGGAGFDVLPTHEQDRLAGMMALIEATAPAIHDDNAGMLAPGRLEAQPHPCLLLNGAASPPVAGAIARNLAARLPQATCVEIPQAGHMLPITHASAVAQAIDSFLAG
ncbi:MAG: alpha/beta hydrolase [Rhodobacteraceae bacterium]|nr:alpha/beta hydrolase [Paracoccaceae bacterium]